MLLAAVALGGHHDLLAGVAGHGALEQEDVGLLAGLQHAEVGVDGGLVVTTQSGRGSGPRQSGSTSSQVGPALAVAGVVGRRKSKTKRGSRSGSGGVR